VNNDVQLASKANISSEDQDTFLMIVIAGNFIALSDYFEDGQDDRIRDLVVDKLAAVYEVSSEEMAGAIQSMMTFFGKVNFPSKKTLYAMSKSVYHRYALNQFQQPFFREKNVPDPILLKHIDEVMEQFLIDWNKFTDKFRITD
jgi:hypothetical protein